MPGKRVPRRALGLGRTVTGHADGEDVGVVVSAGPRVRCGHRCPRCGRHSPPCDSPGRRRRGASTSAPPDATPGTRPCARGAPSTARGPRRCCVLSSCFEQNGTAVGILDRDGTGRKTTCTARGGLATGTLSELGCPTRSAPRTWWNEHERTGEVPASGFATNPKYTAEMRRRAVEHYLEHGKSLTRTMRALGHPKGRGRPSKWAGGLAPGRRGHRGPGGRRLPPRRGCGSSPRPGRGTGPLRGWPNDTVRRGRHPTPGTGR